MPNFLTKLLNIIFGKAKAKIEEKVADFKREKEIIPYPAYGYTKTDEPGKWIIPMRVWVNKARRAPVPDEVIGIFLPDIAIKNEEIPSLRARLKHFVADDDSRERVTIKFDDDPDKEEFTLPGTTDFNGLIQHDLELPAERAQVLLEKQQSGSGWLKYKAFAENFEGEGRVRLVGPEGTSLISDIDDTIKVSEIPAGKRIVLRNTFIRDYVRAPGMLEMYRDLFKTHGESLMFHYVSGSPWQLFKLLHDFLIRDEQFPAGVFHMKDLRKNLLAAESWRDFKNFSAGDEATLEQKVGQISRIFLHFPRRKFILVGDSGEKDPEVYHEIRKTREFAPQILDIYIRDVVGERHKAGSKRLEGMKVIEAPTVVHGVTQFTD